MTRVYENSALLSSGHQIASAGNYTQQQGCGSAFQAYANLAAQ